ncbi:hypothetical protein [Paenibacillus amylolyticus]|uniref:hypothetical protein n=1 Tax=Paenibacillus amylolyticus TaxID=1451 RepID=UPI00201D5912|nr:hypothetical protein [Paenibacillus amylolyticus]MCL6663439.1 hypothetical protein [Paenibacillus amylolyticus]
MEVFSYNRASHDGMRMRRLFDLKYNASQLDVNGSTQMFGMYQVPAVMHSRVNNIKFVFESNLSGFKRPQIHVEADVELAWGDFADHISALNFKHDKQELPLTYVQPLEDDTLKVLIEAGLYREERFELLMGKLMNGETFDAEGDMNLAYLDVAEAAGSERTVPVVLVDPVNIVHEKHDPSERTNLADLVQLAAKNLIELQTKGVKTEDMVRSVPEEPKQIIIDSPIQDVVASHNEQRIINEVDGSFKVSSSLLDKEVDITDQIKGTLGLSQISEDDRIRDLKERDRNEKLQEQQEADAMSQQHITVVNTIESEKPLDPNLFEEGIGSKRRPANQNDDRFPDMDDPSL